MHVIMSKTRKASAPKKQDAEAKCWTYTINNYTTKNHILDEDCEYRIQGMRK